MRVFEDNSQSIGRTPLVRLNRVTDGGKATILAKIEGRNPAYSVKCRIGAAMVWDAEKRGVLGPGKELVEPTSGNTGIALAFVAAARGYPIHLRTILSPKCNTVSVRPMLRIFGKTKKGGGFVPARGIKRSPFRIGTIAGKTESREEFAVKLDRPGKIFHP